MQYSRWGLTRAEQRDNHLPVPAGRGDPPYSHATQDTIGLLDCKHTLLAHVKLSSTRTPKSLVGLSQGFFPYFVYISEITSTQVQNLAFCFVEPH